MSIAGPFAGGLRPAGHRADLPQHELVRGRRHDTVSSPV